MNRIEFQNKKHSGEKITMLTCYDYTCARILAQTSIDCLLVGDSAAMTMHGFKNTVSATLDMMVFHTQAVNRGAPNKFIIADMPFLSYRKSLSKNVSAAQCLMQAGANAVKLESAAGNLELIKHLVESGIPVMGHLGLTMQLMHMQGGLKVQAKNAQEAQKLKNDAMALEEAGCFSIVLECIPSDLAKDVTKRLQIPTIGIGAGSDTDGQVLVLQDLLGLNIDFKPRFVKQFMNGFEQVHAGIEKYIHEVKNREFPNDDHRYTSK